MPDELGRKVMKILPPGDGNRIEDVLDELYTVLYRRGYAITEGRTGMQSLIVLSKVEDQGRRLLPVAQVAHIIPDYGQHAAKGFDYRKVGADRPEVKVQ